MLSIDGYHVYRNPAVTGNLVTIERCIVHADGSVDVDKKVLHDHEVMRLLESVLNE